MSRFNGQYASPGNTKLTCSRTDAIKAAETQLGPAIRKYGAHRLGFAKPMFLRRPGSDLMDLGYRVSFIVKSPSDRSRFYGGAEIGIHGATGKPVGPMVMLEYKGSPATKGS